MTDDALADAGLAVLANGRAWQLLRSRLAMPDELPAAFCLPVPMPTIDAWKAKTGGRAAQ